MGDGKRLLLPDHMTWKESGGRGTAKQHSPPSTFLMAEGHLILRVVLQRLSLCNKQKGLHTPPLSSLFFFFRLFDCRCQLAAHHSPPALFESDVFKHHSEQHNTNTTHKQK